MTLLQVAHYFGCSQENIYRLARRDKLPAFRVGIGHRGWLFLRSQVDNWIAQQQVQPYTPKRP